MLFIFFFSYRKVLLIEYNLSPSDQISIYAELYCRLNALLMQCIVAACLAQTCARVCFFWFVTRVGVGLSERVRAQLCVAFVSVMDSRKMKGRMEAGNLAACCLVREINLGCHGSGPQGTGVHMRWWGV